MAAMIRRLSCSVLLLLAALLGACALAPQLQTPHLSVTEVQLVGSDLWQQRLRVRMHVQNPNDRAIAVKGLEYTLEVEGQQFASGESAASFTVPALGETDFDMNVTTNLAGALLEPAGARAGCARAERCLPPHRQAVAVLGPGALDSVRGARQLQAAMSCV